MGALFSSFLKAAFSSIFDSANIKTFTSAGLATGLVTVGVIEQKIGVAREEMRKELRQEVDYLTTYVDYKNDKVIIKMDMMLDSQKESKEDLRAMQNQMYKIKNIIETDW